MNAVRIVMWALVHEGECLTVGNVSFCKEGARKDYAIPDYWIQDKSGKLVYGDDPSWSIELWLCRVQPVCKI